MRRQGGKENLFANIARNQKYLGRYSPKLEQRKENCGPQEQRGPKPCFPAALPGRQQYLKEEMAT